MMDRTRIAARLVVMMMVVSSSVSAQGKSATAQSSSQMGTPFQQMQTQLSALELQVQAMNQQIQALQAQILQVESGLQAQITAINATLSSVQAQVTAGAETTESLAARITANEAAMAALTSAVAALASQVAHAEALIASNSGDLMALQGHVGSLQTLISAHTSQITALQQQTVGLAQFQANLANGTCATGSAIQDIASGGFIVCTQPGGGTLQTLTRTVGSTLFTGTNFLSVACPTGYAATGSGFIVPAVVETQHYVSNVNFATLSVSHGFRNVTPISVAQNTTGGATATVQVQYLPQTFYNGYFFQVQATCARVQ
jgi:predicted  nucleic acid-binding Zn-ribbon protein